MKPMSTIAKAVGVTALVAPIFIGTGTVDAAYNCDTTNRMCLASGTGGSGYIHDFQVDDSTLVANQYSNTASVSNNNLSVRNRKSTTTRACVYVNTDYLGGTTGYANYTGAGWVNIAYGGSSIRFRYSASC